MRKAGFIGTGSMGRILIEAFIQSGAFTASDIIVSNRTRNKAERLAETHPGMQVSNNEDLVEQSDIFFICVKPLEYGKVLNDIKDRVRSGQYAVSITSPVTLCEIESIIPGKVAKIVPSITNSVLRGASLVMYGSRLVSRDRQVLRHVIGHISRPVEIQEEHVRVASDLASCAPAFLSFLMQRLAHAATEVTGLPNDDALALVQEMIAGVGTLLTEGGYSLQTVQERVAVPGGVTREGLQVMEQRIGTIFHELLRLTQQKHERDSQRVKQMFDNL